MAHSGRDYSERELFYNIGAESATSRLVRSQWRDSSIIPVSPFCGKGIEPELKLSPEDGVPKKTHLARRKARWDKVWRP